MKDIPTPSYTNDFETIQAVNLDDFAYASHEVALGKDKAISILGVDYVSSEGTRIHFFRGKTQAELCYKEGLQYLKNKKLIFVRKYTITVSNAQNISNLEEILHQT